VTVLFHTHLALDFPDRLQAFAEAHPEHRIVSVSGRDRLFAEIAQADVLVDHRISEELLDAAPRLKWIFVPFTGVNALPWDPIRSRGIRVSNNHGNAEVVAERAMALALAAAGRVAEFDRGLRQGRWFRNPGRERPFELWKSLRGARTAILGCGALGRAVARFAGPLVGEVVGYRRRLDRGVPEGFHRVTDSMAEALDGAALCFITLPLTPDTEGLIGAEELRSLAGAILVNVSRGAVVDEEALYQALATGSLAGAGLDAWYRYPKPFHAPTHPSRFPFHVLDNVVLSPHAGSHAPEGKRGQLEGTLENLVQLFDTGVPRDIADPDSGY